MGRSLNTLRLDDGRGPALEVLHAPARRTGRAMLMVHGAYTSAWCWSETFMPYFRDRGYEVYALSLRGHGASEGRQWLDMWGLADYLNDLRRAAAMIARPLTLLGSSMGGLLVQRWLAQGHPGDAAVTIGSVPPTGMSNAVAGMLLGTPRNFAEILNVALTGTANPRFMSLLAQRPMRAKAGDLHYRHVCRESARALWEMTWAPMVARSMPACPVLAVHGQSDRMVPVHTAARLQEFLGAQVMTFEDIGHIPMFETHWERVARAIEAWLRQQTPAQAGARARPDPDSPTEGVQA